MPHTSPPIALSTPNQNLVRLTMMRGITWTGFLLVIIFGINVLQFHLNVLLVVACIMGMGLINLLTWWRLGRRSAVSDQEYVLHLLLDIAGLTLLFCLTGGATNPAISYLLLPITIAAATLRWRSTLLIASVAILSYLLLMFCYIPVPELSRQLPNLPFSLHVIGMGITFLLSAVLLIFFVSKMSLALRIRDRTLARTREAALRSEQILAVASQAAGTAHELGTPLSTISVIVSDMLDDADGQAPLQEDLQLIKQQVDTCKIHLRTLADSARRQTGSVEEMGADEWFKRVLDRWTVMRHDMEFQLEIAKGRPPLIEVDATLEQAMMNLLNNAADANPDNIEIQLYWERQEVIFDIRDHGDGVPLEIADQLGDTFISTHSKGMGIGLFLTHSTLDRFGGSVRLYNHEGGGTLTEVRLPVAYSAQ